MTPEREKVIREVWKEVQRFADFNRQPVWFGRERPKLLPLRYAPVKMEDFTPIEKFAFERRIYPGMTHNTEYNTIECEGIVLAEWFTTH